MVFFKLVAVLFIVVILTLRNKIKYLLNSNGYFVLQSQQ